MLVNQSVDGFAALAGFLMFFFTIIAIISVIIIVSNWKLFTKAGEEGWKSIVPLYNSFTMINIAFSGKKNWLMIAVIASALSGFMEEGFVMTILSLAAAAINIYISYNFINRYAGSGMAVLSLFFPMIIYPIVAFSDKYQYTEYTY